MFHLRGAILIQIHIQQWNHLELYTEKEDSATHPRLNGVILVLIFSQLKGDELQELFGSFSSYNLLIHCKFLSVLR